MTASTAVTWKPRPYPLEALAVLAFDTVARQLAHRCLELSDDELHKLQGLTITDAKQHGIVVIGASANLPWVDGALYLGRDSDAPSLLLSTTKMPDVPVTLFEKALLKSLGNTSQPPLAVWPAPPLVASTAKAKPLDRASLENWLQPDQHTKEQHELAGHS